MALILLIEDEKILRENTQELLEAHGFACITTAEGKDGVSLARECSPDLILCDITLQSNDGYDVKRELNQYEETVNLPFIFLTARAERDDRRRGIDLGAADYITKPFKITELITSIERRLALKNDLKETVNNHNLNIPADLIQVAKHACNTPLHAIINLSELVKDYSNNHESIEEIASAINASGKKLFKTLNNFIELMRLRHYEATIPRPYEYLNIADVIKKIALEQAHRYNRLLDLSLKIDDSSCGNISKQDLMLLNYELIDNAMKFSPNGSMLIIESRIDTLTNKLLLVVINQITEPISLTVDKISPFNLNKNSGNEPEGNGAGLYLALLICKKYLGELVIKNDKTLEISVMVSLPVS